MQAISEKPTIELHTESKLTTLKEYTEHALCHPSVLAFNIICQAEEIFRRHSLGLSEVDNARAYIMAKIAERVDSSTLCQLHNLVESILSKFIDLRLTIFCDTFNKNNCFSHCLGHRRGSKSMAMRQLVNTF